MKPRSLMFTLFGEYIQYYGGEIWVGSLIRIMDRFGVSESSVRGAILRMTQKDLMQVRKIGNRSYYSFTEEGKKQIDEGVKRVYSEGRVGWDGQWRILMYSFPEDKRDMRNEIRKALHWIGFGAISHSTWVSPNPVDAQVINLIEKYELENYLMLFSSSQVTSHSNQEVVNKGWNLKEISDEYEIFVSAYTQKLNEIQEKALNNTLSDEESFIERTYLVHEYRKFLFKDPLFPEELLPSYWKGTEARELFRELHQMLSIQSLRYFETLFAPAPDTDSTPQHEKAINPFNKIYI